MGDVLRMKSHSVFLGSPNYHNEEFIVILLMLKKMSGIAIYVV